MGDFVSARGSALDQAYDEELANTPLPDAPEMPHMAPIHWSPDQPAPLAPSGPLPGLFTSAGVEESPLMTAQERKQHASEAALLAKGGQFTGDGTPSWSQSHTAKDAPPGPGAAERFGNFHDQVENAEQTYEDKLGYSPGFAGVAATGTVAIEDLVGDIASGIRGTTQHTEGVLEAPTVAGKIEEGSRAVADFSGAFLAAGTIVDPASALMDGGGGGALARTPALAHAASDAATEIAADAPKTAIDGPLARWTDDEELEGSGRGALQDLHGEGPETDAMHETGKSGAGMAEKPKHHVYPQEHRAWFEERGFTGENDIDQHTVTLEDADHQAIHGGGDHKLGRQWGGEWNQSTMEALGAAEEDKGAQLTPDEIKAIVEQRMTRYSIPRDYVPYKKK